MPSANRIYVTLIENSVQEQQKMCSFPVSANHIIYTVSCNPPQKKTLSKFKRTEIIQNEFSGHNRITLEMNNKVNKKISIHSVTKQTQF